jgi:hypothetical protein
VFEAESWPFRLTFTDVDGVVGALRVEGPAVGPRGIAGTYAKTAA